MFLSPLRRPCQNQRIAKSRYALHLPVAVPLLSTSIAPLGPTRLIDFRLEKHAKLGTILLSRTFVHADESEASAACIFPLAPLPGE